MGGSLLRRRGPVQACDQLPESRGVGSDQSDEEETEKVLGDDGEGDLSQLPAGSPPSHLATILVAMAASLFLLLSMYMAVGIFSLLVGTPPVRQSGALTFYEFSPDLQQKIQRPIRTSIKLSTPTRRLLESCVMNESVMQGQPHTSIAQANSPVMT